MGRYNNRRTQQAAAALQNTPARARFSKGPPNKNNNKNRTNKSTTTTTNKNDNTTTTKPPAAKRGTTTTAIPKQTVVDKMKRRMEPTQQQQQQSSSSMTAEHSSSSLQFGDVTKYDQLILSNHALTVITTLLTDLGIIVVNPNTKTSSRNSTNIQITKYNNTSNSNNKDNGQAATTTTTTTTTTITTDINSNEQENDNDTNMEEDDEEEDDDEDDILLQNWATTTTTSKSNDRMGSTGLLNEQNDGNINDDPTTNNRRGEVVSTGRYYSEYEEDADEEVLVDDEIEHVRIIGDEIEWEEREEEEDNDDDDDDVNATTTTTITTSTNQAATTTTTSQNTDDDDDGDKEDETYEDFQENVTFRHLTQHLSFSPKDAARACYAVEHWIIPGTNTTTATTNNNTINSSDSQAATTTEDGKTLMKHKKQNDKQQLSLAMDWLCLHLEEITLTNGFRLNQTDKTNNNNKSSISSLLLSARGVPLVGSGLTRAIPHPSISVAKPLTSDKEWTESVRLQERIVRLLRLGFLHSEASEACSISSSSRPEEEKGEATTDDIRNDSALFQLLIVSEQKATNNQNKELTTETTLNQTDLDYAAEERDQERQALSAIYDDHFQILPPLPTSTLSDSSKTTKTGRMMDRYSVSIAPPEDAADGSSKISWEKSNLLIVCRPGYPVVEAPLLLFQNPSCPPALLRKINHQLAIQAQGTVGAPAVFEIISYLSESLSTLLDEFLKEQQEETRKEKAEQDRSRKQGSSSSSSRNPNNKDEDNYDDDDDILEDGKPLGRRQRAKLKAAEKSYQSGEKLEQWKTERRERQDTRLERIRQEESQIRQSMAERAIAKRQEEQGRTEAERVARSAMNDALNRGVTTEEARAVAHKARVETLLEHGIAVSVDDQEQSRVQGGNINNHNKNKATVVDEAFRGEDVETQAATEGKFSAQIDNGDDGAEATPTTASFMARLQDKASEVSGSVRAEQSDTVAFSQPEATPTTAAFMDRLRQMYDNAVQAKLTKGDNSTGDDVDASATRKPKPNSGKKSKQLEPELDAYHLEDPDLEQVDEDNAPVRLPRPVAVPKGELADVMKDVISQQRDQPWLVFAEARTPIAGLNVASKDAQESGRGGDRHGVTPEQQRRQREISKKLRQDLERKRKSAEVWAAENHNGEQQQQQKRSGGFNKNNAFAPNKFHAMMTARQRLPAFKMEHEIVATIAHNQITVIAGDTGCGKTTQVPQLVLDNLILQNEGAATNIIVTQPRRISAIGVSERIAEERCERVGETCGYSIKLEKKMTSKTRLLLCTTGILLRRLQCDPDLAAVSHIFVDEVHERDLNTDFLLIILKDLLARRKCLKLILMSATLNSDAFSAYFGGCPVVSIPGRAHPVVENRLEDILELTGYQVLEHSDCALKISESRPPRHSKSAMRKMYYPKYSKETIHSLSIVDESLINYELLAELLEHITLNNDEGAILVFMPGMMEIQKAVEEMYKKEIFQSSAVLIYPLHSSLSTAEQTAIFEVPPDGVRKIVVSTNIAETSITIEDVVFVVDCGRVKENRRDEINETPQLVECWVSRASSKQRRGRAGRVRPGIAYHMYSSHTHDQELQDYQLPEMLRVGIEDLVLQILILDLGEPTSFLRKALNPPTDMAMSNSLKLLETLGAIDCKWQKAAKLKVRMNENGEEQSDVDQLDVSSELTALGFHLATLPVDPRVGKMMIYGSLFGCVDPALTIAASMSARSPFMSPFDKRDAADEARKTFAAQGSDHLTILNAFGQWKDLASKQRKKHSKEVQSFLHENFLSRLTLFQMEDLRKQFANLLTEIGFLPEHFRLNDYANSLNHQGGSSSSSPENANATNVGLLKAVLCAGLYPNIIVAPRPLVADPNSNSGTGGNANKKKVGECAFQSHTKGEVYLHPSTISFEETKLDSRYCCFHEMVKTSKTYVRDCTTVSPFALLLFGGALEVYHRQGVCSVDGWLKFRLAAKSASLIKHLRSQMEHILFQKIVSPDQDVISDSPEGRALIQSISTLFLEEEKKLIVPDRSGGAIVRPWRGNEEERNQANSSRGGGQNFTSNNNNVNSSNYHDGNHEENGGGRGRRGGGRGGGRGGNGRGREGSRGGSRGGRGRGRRGGR